MPSKRGGAGEAEVRGRNVEVTEALRALVQRRLQFALARFDERIGRVTVRLVDLNGPRGGDDKSCRITVRLRPTGIVFVEDVKDELHAAIDRAAERAGRSVSRELEVARAFEGTGQLRGDPAGMTQRNVRVPDGQEAKGRRKQHEVPTL